MAISYRNKVVWITGASSGIGEALAIQFASEGARMVLSATRQNELERVKELCLNAGAADCMVLPLNLTQLGDVNELTQKVISRFGGIDILVNNGGVSQRSYTIETPIDVDRKIMEVNFFGGVALTKSVLPYMVKNGGGHLVATSSISGKFGFPLRSAYCASKHALHGFYEAIYTELYKENIKVTIAVPGRVQTNISLSAITKDGSAHGVMDHGQNEGISAEKCARKIIKAMKRGKVEVVTGGKEIIMVYLKRYIPALFYFLAKRVRPT
jgi:dehydrogenase/reductase SDR family member 7B